MRRTIRNLIAVGIFAAFLLEFASPADAQFRRRRGRNYNYAPAPTYYYEQSAPVYYEQSAAPVYTQPAEEEQLQTQPSSTTTTRTNLGGRRLSYFQNTPIHLSNGATAGRIVDYVMNAQGGVDYIVVMNNGQYMLIPYSVANFDWNQRYVTVNNLDQARFGQIPTFTQQQWSSVFAPQSAYMGRINSFFGAGSVGASTGANFQSGARTGVQTGVQTQSGIRATGTNGFNGTGNGNDNLGPDNDRVSDRETSGTTPPAPVGGVNSLTRPSSTNPGTPPRETNPAGSSPGPVGTSPGTPTRGPINPPQPLTPSLPSNPGGAGATPTNTNSGVGTGTTSTRTGTTTTPTGTTNTNPGSGTTLPATGPAATNPGTSTTPSAVPSSGAGSPAPARP